MQSIIRGGLAAAWLYVACSLPVAAAGLPAVFNPVEVRADAQLALPQWHQVLGRIQAERPIYPACATGQRSCTSKAAIGWQSLLESLQGQDRLTQVRVASIDLPISASLMIPTWKYGERATTGRPRWNFSATRATAKATRSSQEYEITSGTRRAGGRDADGGCAGHRPKPRPRGPGRSGGGQHDGTGQPDQCLVAPGTDTRSFAVLSVNENARWAHLARDGHHVAALNLRKPVLR